MFFKKKYEEEYKKKYEEEYKKKYKEEFQKKYNKKLEEKIKFERSYLIKPWFMIKKDIKNIIEDINLDIKVNDRDILDDMIISINKEF